MKEYTITARDIAMQLLDIQHALVHYAQSRQLFLVQSCDALAAKLQLYQQSEGKLHTILECEVM